MVGGGGGVGWGGGGWGVGGVKIVCDKKKIGGGEKRDEGNWGGMGRFERELIRNRSRTG